MTDYIKRGAVLQTFLEYGIGWGTAKVKGVINSIPSADVRENVHAHWEKPTQVGNYMLKNIPHCSACGYIPCDEGKRFCANCGAKMNGGDGA